MIEVLTPIWKRVLKRSAIGIEDNFFDLGGDSILAVNLFAGNRAGMRPTVTAGDDLPCADDRGAGGSIGTTDCFTIPSFGVA